MGQVVAHGGGCARRAPFSGRSRDPLSLKGLAPDDENNSYANVLASKLWRGNDRIDMVGYLTTRLLGKGDLITPKWIARCEAAADALMKWYAHSNAPR
jgi:hypothetical protein